MQERSEESYGGNVKRTCNCGGLTPQKAQLTGPKPQLRRPQTPPSPNRLPPPGARDGLPTGG